MSTSRMLEMAAAEAAASADPSTKVGGVLQVYAGPTIVGHNTFVGLKDPAAASREERYADVVHAEEVVLMRAGRRAHNGLYYGTHEPCGRCWRRLVLAGVHTVTFPVTDPERRERWGCEEGRQIALDAGVIVREVGA